VFLGEDLPEVREGLGRARNGAGQEIGDLVVALACAAHPLGKDQARVRCRNGGVDGRKRRSIPSPIGQVRQRCAEEFFCLAQEE
jgi:hypothetical protein